MRFKAMMTAAGEAADRASLERQVGSHPSSSMLAAIKAMNRAGGFLEAVGIMLPELGAELIDEFESFAARVDGLSRTAVQDAERREAARRGVSDRRGWDRRMGRDRRRRQIEVTEDRRLLGDRRSAIDRRTGRVRELADRRLRALHH